MDHATVDCGDCGRSFSSSMPLSRSRFATSSLMFLVEVCPHCDDFRTYLRHEYHFDAGLQRLSA